MDTRRLRFAFAVVLTGVVTDARAINIGVVLDASRAATAVIGTAGGSLTATASDGTIFTLTIPSQALLSSETVTITPVAQAMNVPFSGGLVAGVELEPS